MKRQLLIAVLTLLACSVRAQTADRQVLGNAGSSFSGTGISADYTVGEVATASATSGSFLLTQGFQQPVANSTAVQDPATSVRWSLYPNPAQQFVTLELNSSVPADLLLSVTAVNGQVIFPAEKLDLKGSLKKEISLSGLVSGIYMVNLYNHEGSLLHSIRLCKQ